MAKVLSDDEARSAINQIKQIINGDLLDTLTKLNTNGEVLMDPNHWDGNLAQKFRHETWPGTRSALNKAKTELEDLHQQLQKISDNIFQAGGN